ncbi:MAG TPA: hypothetical protein VG013_09875 [Gemmataceae bacterium]|jgi:hypothetical protein|nr:hypothetical protein [Gemmataceae bacterium]
MNEPWFDPMYAWLPGTLLGVIAGSLGGLAGWLGPKGKAKALVLGGFWVLFGVSAVMLVAGLAGYFSGQPYGVWYGLGLAGLIGVLVLGLNAPQLFRWYRQAEERRMSARDLG